MREMTRRSSAQPIPRRPNTFVRMAREVEVPKDAILERLSVSGFRRPNWSRVLRTFPDGHVWPKAQTQKVETAEFFGVSQ